MAVGFRCWGVGAWPILRLRGHGHSRWAARSGPVVSFLQRAVLCEVAEDGADGVGFFDAGHDPYRTAAVDAGAHVDAKHALEALGKTGVRVQFPEYSFRIPILART